MSGPPPTGAAVLFEPTSTPGTQPVLPQLPELAVEEFGPKGLVDVGAEPYVRFNQQVVDVGEDLLAMPGLRVALVPDVAGRNRFRTPELLVFEPKKALKLAQYYQARVAVLPSASQALSALLAAHPLSWAFHTPGPAVMQTYPANDVPPDKWSRRQPVLIKLTQPVTGAGLRKFLSVRSLGADGAPIAVYVDPVSPAGARHWDWASDLLADDEPLTGRLFQVRPVDGWPVDRQIAVDIAAGVVGRLGPVPSTVPWRLTWTTPGPLRVESVTTEDAFCEQTAIVIHLNAPIAASQLSHVRISPRPVNTKLSLDEYSDYSDDSGQPRIRSGDDIRFRGAFVPGQTYTIQIDASLRDLDGYTVGDGTSGKGWSAPISVAGDPNLQLSQGGVFADVASPLFGVTSRMIKSLRIRAATLDLKQTQQVQFGSEDLKSPSVFEHLGIPQGNIVVRDYPLDVQAPTYWSDKAFDLRELVGDIPGAVLIEVAPLGLVERPKNAPVAQALAAQRAVYRRTDLGPIAFHSITKSVIKVARLSNGRPVVGAQIARIDGSSQVALGRTDNQGLLVVQWKAGQLPKGSLILSISEQATRDRVLVRLASESGYLEHDPKAPAKLIQRGEHLLLQLTTERDAYRPEESVALVGFAIVDTPFTPSGLRLLPPGTTIMARVIDREQKVTAEQSLQLNADGKFWARLPIPTGTPLGGLTITAEAQGAIGRASAKLEDFRVPEFEVSAHAANDSLLIGENTAVRVHASHYSGAPVTFEEMAYLTSCRPSRYSVPGLAPGWVAGDATLRSYRTTHSVRRLVSNARGARGSVEFTPNLETGDSTSLLCSLAVEVKDASQQPIGAETSVRIHPASVYLALQAPDGLREGDAASIALQALSIDGQRRAANDVKLNVTRTWMEEIHKTIDGRVHTSWRERHDNAAKCWLDAKVDRNVFCTIAQAQRGEYTIEASARDAARTALTTATFYVSPPIASSSPTMASKADNGIPERLSVELLRTDASESPERQLAPGDHLRATVHSPCASVVALLERGGIREHHALTLANHTATLNFLIDDTWIPQVDLQVQTLCKADAGSPKVDNITQHITVSSAQRELRVVVSVPAHATPGQALPIAVEVHNADNEPVRRGHVALWAVDEAVLSLGEHRVESPLRQFLTQRGAETSTSHEYGALLPAYVPQKQDPLLDPAVCDTFGSGGLGLSGIGSGGGGRGEGIGFGLIAPRPARARFETTPIFIGEQQLDDQGRAHLQGRLPDNLTTFRVTAIASAPLANDVTTGRFGVGESQVQVSAPFILRPSLPRQMRPGDTAELAAILQNQTNADGQVTLTASTDAKAAELTFLDATTQQMRLGPGEQLRVPLHVRAERAGVAQVELRARFVPADGQAVDDAVRIPLPIVTEPTLVERTAHYGTLDSSAAVAVSVRVPTGVVLSVGGLSLSLSTSLAGELEDAFKYLVDYPYGCIEQTSSRVLALVAARELAQRFGIDGTEANRRLMAGIERIVSMQTDSGGFGYWTKEENPHPYATGFATRVLLLAQRSGAQVPKAALERALDYLSTWVKKDGAQRTGDSSAWVETGLFPSERAMALSVLADAERSMPAAALQEALASRSVLPAFAQTLLLSALARAKPTDPRISTLIDELLGAVTELPAAAHVRETQSARWENLFQSQSRTDAMALLALMQLRPEHALVPKLARGLMDARVNGRWRNTQENAYALLSMLEYIRRSEAERPDFAARAWVGSRPLFETRLTWAAPNKSTLLPTAQLLEQPQPLSVVLQREGQGRLYFRLGTEWQQAVTEAPARDQGMTIERSVRLRNGRTGASVPVGEALAFDIALKTRSPLAYVAIEVPVPAGLEPVLDDLGKGHTVSSLGGAKFADYEERHPDRVVLFVNRLDAGEHHHTVQLRAVTPGEFALPAARVEAMYMPEIYGRTTGGRLTVTGE